MASILIKSSRSEEALNILNRFTGDPSPLSFIHYLRGNILQQKGEYQESTDSFNNFLTEFKGHNFVKDVNFKIGLNYWLLFDSVLAEKYFELARNTGETLIEADKNAASMLKEPMPDINIMKLRLHTDGGYFQEAYNLVTEIEESKLDSHKDSVEFIYRKARLFHKSGNKEEAIINYEKTIEENENERWYFAPNSALQLGYIYREKGMLAEARKLFEKAVSYKNHPYKHSIDNEAKAALASLNTKN
jgi:tetratricopeptide (TPR) repeat protein